MNTRSTISWKLFPTGALCLAVAVLSVACGGGSDSPALPAVAPAGQAASAPSPSPSPASATSPAPDSAPPASAPPAAASTEASAAQPQDAFQQESLDAHNKARAEENKGLSSLKWSASLHTDAQALADQCKFEHVVPKGQGQNLYTTSESTASVGKAVQSWMSEKADYTYGPTGGTCAPGKPCGHYTQVIWSTTTEVGCGVKTCENITANGNARGAGTVLVCNYSPPGNFRGQPPYPAP